MRQTRAILRLTTLLLASLLAGCGGEKPPVGSDPDLAGDSSRPGAAPGAGWPTLAACNPLAGSALPGGDLVLALGGAVSPEHAPLPLNESERTVFANLYETLTSVACTGELLPALASDWERLDHGRRWRLHLRAGAVFWDGSPVTAFAVVQSWRRNERVASALGRPCPGLWLATGSRGLLAVDAGTLEIRLAEAQDDLPRLLAHPALAVAAIREGWLWPVGSGPCRLAADHDLPLPDLVCQPNLHHPDRPAWRSLTFRIKAGHDPRDLLDAGSDLALIRDAHAGRYYAQLPGISSAPLPWNRLYALLLPPETGISAEPGVFLMPESVTPGESRSADSLLIHGCLAAPCPQLQGPTVGLTAPPQDVDPALEALRRRRLYYTTDDPDAAALAQRIAIFLQPDIEVYGADQFELAQALQQGAASGFVVGLDAGHPTACHALATLLARADWLQHEVADERDPCRAAAWLVQEELALPLVETRARLVWRGDLAGLRLAHDGALLVSQLGAAAPAVTP
jgi:hypothetical protein